MLHIIDNPLITVKLNYMRDERTNSKDFRTLLDEISSLMTLEVFKDLKLHPTGKKYHTPLGQEIDKLDIDYNMANLLEDVAKTNIERVRFVTSHPWDFSDDMIDTILNFDLDVVLAGLNESSHHLSQMEFISLIVITVGAVLLCLTGLKLVRFWSVIAGLSAGCAAGIAVGVIAGLDQTIALAAGAGVGLVLAVLGAWKKQIGGFVTVAVLVFVVSVHLMKPQDLIMYGICAGIGLVCALLSIKFHNFMLIASSSVFGAMAAGSSIFYLQPYKNGMIHVALCVAIGALSIWIQLLLESGKRKKKNLLKAAEIREEHSTENEVEKARALVENLDDFDELDEIIESLPENVLKEDKGTTVVSMDEFDDLEDDLEEDEVENFKEEKFDVDEEDVEIEVTADEVDATEDYDFDEDPDDLDDLNDLENLDDLDYLDDDDDIEFLDEDE